MSRKINLALLGIFVIGFCFPQWVYAQDEPTVSSAAITVRSSPFNPPTENVFIADDGPGLDTGCTFNDDFNHPLLIDIVVDQFVGAVDANGFLVNPAPLIAKGIIPASIEVIMPAFDVDVNGTPPPERDEVIFNGQSLGTLNGDNDIWLLNSFTVDISKVKFPAATGGTATNRVQINVDTLSSGRWCTAIDWVALVIPIKPKIALTITVMGGNKIREIADDVIYKQSFDADCNVTTDIGPFENFPFSGSSNKEVSLRTKIEFCPNTGVDPEVKAMWEVNGPAPLQKKGTSTWSGFEGDVKLKMLDRVTVGSADIDYEIDGQTTSLSRKLFITKNDPLASVSPPKKSWYEKAVPWGKGAGPGESDEMKILENLLSGEYAFGNSNWRYGYNFGGVTKCNWQDLVNDPLSCNYSDCYVFSDVFENMAAVLGIGGLSAIQVLGTNSDGFVTSGAPSIDPAFPGSARPFAGGAFDRYLFSSHSLRLKGKYYDATFNGIYTSSTQFISWNLTGANAIDADGLHLTTDEGAKIYPLVGNSYDSWPAVRYKTPPPLLASAAESQIEQTAATTLIAQNLQFTGNNTFTEVDTNSDGIFEALQATVEVETSTAGEYTIFGILQKSGVTIADRPTFESMLFTAATFTSTIATHNIDLTFSGEQIFRSGEDGPYDLLLFSIGPNNESAQTTFATPAVDHTQYGETAAALTGASDSALDSDSDGDFDFIQVAVSVTVRTGGDFSLQGDLSKNGGSLSNAGDTVNLGMGTHSVELEFPGSDIRRSGQNGPYTGTVSLMDDTGHTLQSISFTTQPYTASDFGALLMLDGNFSDQGIDTNSNSLFDLLRVNFGADVQTAGNYLVSGQLTGAGNNFVAFTDMPMILITGSQTITLDFLGPVIHEQGIDGPYAVEVVMRNETSFEELDRITVGTTQGYSYTDFEPFVGGEILLTGNSNAFGVDTNSNGLFDELHVEIEVALTTSDFYQWSARLVDANGTEIDFDSRSVSLSAGLATINFIFDGAKIGANGVNGPYFIKGLLMFGQTGPNIVAVDVAETQAFTASQFEGYTSPNGALRLTKQVINDNIGTKTVGDFTLFVGNTQVTSGVEASLPAGTYQISEGNADGYRATYSGDCNAQGLIQIESGVAKQCVITNNDIPPLTFGIANGVAGTPGQTATVDFTYGGNGNSVNVALFSVDYDQNCLSFDPTDSNSDGIPDAVQLNLPTGFGASILFDAADTDGELDLALQDVVAPYMALPNGTILRIDFLVSNNAACESTNGSPVSAAVNFSADPTASFGSPAGESIPALLNDGGVLIQSPTTLPGNCNADNSVDAGDIAAIVLEIFDGDGAAAADVAGGSFVGGPGCDANTDAAINAADISCTVLRIFNSAAVCGGATTAFTGTRAQLAIADGTADLAKEAATVAITLTGNGNKISAAAFVVHYDAAHLSFDESDADGDGVPDALTLAFAAEEQLFSVTSDEGRLALAVADLSASPAGFADGTLLSITFDVKNAVGAEATTSVLSFSKEEGASLGSPNGVSIAVAAEDGSLTTIPVEVVSQLYLPLVSFEE